MRTIKLPVHSLSSEPVEWGQSPIFQIAVSPSVHGGSSGMRMSNRHDMKHNLVYRQNPPGPSCAPVRERIFRQASERRSKREVRLLPSLHDIDLTTLEIAYHYATLEERRDILSLNNSRLVTSPHGSRKGCVGKGGHASVTDPVAQWDTATVARPLQPSRAPMLRR